MSGSIVRALNWDVGVEQRFIAVNPLGDEVVLYQTHHRDAAAESNDIVKVASCGGFDNIQCCAYSPVDVGLAAVGQTSGIVSVFDVAAGGGTALHLKPKQPRQCNAVCFNAAGLVAAGFDKGRQDNLLQLWNIEHFLRTANDHLQRPLYLCIPNEAVVLAVFAPDRATNLVVGSYKFLREVDLRQDAPVFQLATRCTLGVAVDPFRPHLVLAYAEDGSYLVWDRRKLAPAGPRRALAATEAPLLLFARLFGEGKKRGPWVRHSTIRPGEFAAVFNGDLIRRWNTGVVPPREAGASGGASTARAGSRPASSSSTASAASSSTAASSSASSSTRCRLFLRSRRSPRRRLCRGGAPVSSLAGWRAFAVAASGLTESSASRAPSASSPSASSPSASSPSASSPSARSPFARSPSASSPAGGLPAGGSPAGGSPSPAPPATTSVNRDNACKSSSSASSSKKSILSVSASESSSPRSLNSELSSLPWPFAARSTNGGGDVAISVKGESRCILVVECLLPPSVFPDRAACRHSLHLFFFLSFFSGPMR